MAGAAGLTIGDQDSTNHGSKHHREGEDFKPEWGHVASSSKGSIFLLHERKQKQPVLKRPLSSGTKPQRALPSEPIAA